MDKMSSVVGWSSLSTINKNCGDSRVKVKGGLGDSGAGNSGVIGFGGFEGGFGSCEKVGVDEDGLCRPMLYLFSMVGDSYVSKSYVDNTEFVEGEE
ncbi:hypothetical protein Tco_1095555 [Tanacetum coccineum]